MSRSAAMKFVKLSPILLLVANLSLLDCCALNSSGSSSDKDVCKVSDPVKVGVFFESLCPDSKRFFLKQLVPTYRDIGNIMQVDLIAFGHAKVFGTDKMICQHGARECDGNRLMACILKQRGVSQKDAIETIGCVFENKQSHEECVKKYLPGVAYGDIERCKNSTMSYRLMVEYAGETGDVDYVPHLTFNGKHSEDIQQGLEFNLKRYVCENYNGTKPDECKNLPEKRNNYYS